MISGKEALIALANGENVQCANADLLNWNDVGGDCHLDLFTTAKNRNGYNFIFRLKPRTITLNGIEVPAPFEPKEGDEFYIIQPCNESGWMGEKLGYKKGFSDNWIQFGAWRTEGEIKQVVEALRNVFNP